MTDLPAEPIPGQLELPLDFGEVSDPYDEDWPMESDEGFDFFVGDVDLLRAFLGEKGGDCE